MISGQVAPLLTSLTNATVATPLLSASSITTATLGTGTSARHCTVIPEGFDAVGLIKSVITIKCVTLIVLPQASVTE